MNELDALLERLLPGAGGRPDDDPPPELPPSLGYAPRGLLGRGASGWVLRAHDAPLDRDVAVKIARPGAEDEVLAEAARTAAIAHPAVLPVFRVERVDGRLVVVSALAPGVSLAGLRADWLARPDEAWDLARRLALLGPLAGALARAHELGLVHGDVHPGNVRVGPADAPYLLDWSGPSAAEGFTGTPEWAAPEQLRGGAADASADVFALAALTWELVALRPFRTRRPDEPLGVFVARARQAPPPSLPADAAVPAGALREGLVALLDAALGPPSARPAAAAFAESLARLTRGEADRVGAERLAEARVAEARSALLRAQEAERRIAEELRVATIQRAKVPGYAPLADKRAAWEAEDRARALAAEQAAAWLGGMRAAEQAVALAPDRDEAHAVLADLWWDRLRRAEAAGDAPDAALASEQLRAHDRGRWAPILDAPGRVSLDCPVPGARVTLARFDDAAVRRAVPVEERALPLVEHRLAPGSWLLTVRAPGFADTIVPLRVERLDHHRATVTLHTAEAVGEGWVFVPGGPFRMGGDPLARNALDACTPTVGDRFFTRTCVTTAEYLEWLNDDPAAEAHVPGEMALFGVNHPLWRRGPDGRFGLPPGWDLRWPILCVNLEDARAYAAWRSAREGREVRLPTEEEWEKAARGVDGRPWPWGSRFDPTFCRMRESQPHAPGPAPVASMPVDRSVYGLMDTAGGVREWTTSPYSIGQVVLRGGTWGDDADDCRSAGRAGVQPAFRTPWVGFRLVAEAPRPAATAR